TVTATDDAGNSKTVNTARHYDIDTTPPIITLEGSVITESTTGEITGEKAKGTVTIKLDKAQSEDLVVKLKNEVTGEIQDIIIKAGETSKTVEVETSRVDDAYKQGTTTETVSIASTSNSKIDITDKTATITIQDDIDPVNMTITATVTTPKIIDVNTKLDGSTGVKMYADSEYGKADISVIKGTNHDGFGVLTTDKNGKSINKSNGDTRELGLGEKIVVEFTDGKDVNSLDVSFAWRNNNETAKLTFIKDDKVVGFATVDGDGKSTTKAIVKYYDINNNIIKEVNAKGSSDKVDEAFTFELPSSKESGADLVSFDKVEFSAPKSKDDYLIHEIKYKEVLNTEVTDIVTNGGNVTFNIQIDEKYPPQGKATAMVEVNGKTYQVELNATGRGTLTIDSKELGDLSNIVAKVVKVEGGKYEKVNPKEETFKFTPTLKSTDDNISTDEDVPYTLTINDFGDITGISTKTEFKITELPTNGNLYLIVKKGETIFNPDGTKTEATEDVKIEITKDQVLTLGQVGGGKVVFEPTPDSDEDGSFKFQVGDGNGKFSEEYTTTIDVKAVADAPTVSIDVTKLGETTIVVDGNGNESNSSGIKALDILKVNPNYNGQETIDNDYSYSGNDDITKNYQNLNGGATNITTDKGNDTLEFQSLNSKNINSGAGDDKVIINQTSSSNNIQLGEGNNSYTIAGSLNSGTTQSGAGNDTLIVNQGASNTVINLGDGNNTISIGEALNNSNISTGNGNDTLIVGQASDNNTISTGGGNDFVQLNHNVQGTKIDLGTGNDGIRLSNEGHVNFNTETLIDGGADFDTLYLNGKETDYWIEDANHNKITYSQYVQENKDINGYSNKLFYIYEVDGNGTKQGSGFKIKNVEDIVFEKDAPKEVIIKAVEYKVDISAALTDKDGSETLSVVIKNVPESATLESSKYEVSKNDDGSYTVTVPAGAKDISGSLTMKVPESYKGEINLQIEAKATETRDNEDGQNFEVTTDSDAVVITTDETSVLTVSNEATNIVLTLDVTTSMVYNSYRKENHTSLHVLQKSAISTIEAYSSKGETNVNMTIFSKTAHNLGWMTSSEAIDYLKKLTQDENGNELKHWELNEKLETKLGITDVSTTNYKNAIAETVKEVDFSEKSGNNVGYFISDGRPWDDSKDTTQEDYSIGKDYEDQASWNNWETFIKDNNIDFKAIGIGMPEDNKKAESFLQDIQAVMGHKDIILIDEPTSMETIFLSTVGGTVSGDISDNIFGGDGKVTIDSIVVGDTTYNKADYPYGLSTDKLGGKLTFDFETGKYAYNGNGIEITENEFKSFQVNVIDKNGDKGSLDVNFELKAQPITDGLVKFEKGGDINFSNLENIVNLKEINLDNGKENKLNLTLDDVLKLSGNDKQIKITGDQFDSVAFKNEAGNEWELKTENMGKVEGDKTFDVYTNSGDPTVQVKVEDKISDGITS
ncbi:calcium-binding protein, partial [Aliarcobacter cryaerophilus]|uniref:calcium-binding protein n=1 Tax=Aliarcobacter cryaerophilus TaxID=28198 RepID=UPI0021B67740